MAIKAPQRTLVNLGSRPILSAHPFTGALVVGADGESVRVQCECSAVQCSSDVGRKIVSLMGKSARGQVNKAVKQMKRAEKE